MIEWTATPVPLSTAASERENASWACFDAAYAPAGAKAVVPATEIMFTTCAPSPAPAHLRPGSNARVIQTLPR